MAKTYTEYAYFKTVIISPIVPTGLKLDQTGNTVRLSWLDSSNYEDGFVIQRKNGSGSWKTLYFVGENKDLFVDYGPFTDGETYYYRVSSYIVLPNQKYLISDPSSEASLKLAISSASADSESLVEVEFGNSISISIDLHYSLKAYIKDASATEEYLWFVDGDCVSLSGHNDYADLFALKLGTSKIVIKKANSSGESTINITVSRDEIESNPALPTNLRVMSLGASEIQLLWNYSLDSVISHFEVYRVEKTGSSSKNNLIDFTDLTKNRIATVPFDSLQSVYNLHDYGLKSGTIYIYAVVAISKYDKSSLYNGKSEYDYIYNKKYILAGTQSGKITVDPSLAYVSPGSSLYIGIFSESSLAFSSIEWTIDQNNSGSELKTTDEEVAYFEASDKSISKDIVKVQADSYSATARIIVTETI